MENKHYEHFRITKGIHTFAVGIVSTPESVLRVKCENAQSGELWQLDIPASTIKEKTFNFVDNLQDFTNDILVYSLKNDIEISKQDHDILLRIPFKVGNLKRSIDLVLVKLNIRIPLEETLILRIEALEEKLRRKTYWTDIGPTLLGLLDFASLNKDYEFSLAAHVPADAEEVRIMYAVRCGSEVSGFFNVKLWTRVHNRTFTHHKRGFRFGQHAISFDSESFWFPITPDMNSRLLYANTDQMVPSNCHKAELYVTGWR